MARERYLVGVSKEELEYTPYSQTPTPKGKWENFWYHYKWLAIGAVFFIAVLSVVIVQIATKVKPDYTVCVVTQQEWSPQATDRLQAEFEALGKDRNGDGQVVVSVQVFNVSAKSPNSVANRQAVQTRIVAKDVRLFVMDPEYYTYVLQPLMDEGTQFFAPLGVDAVGVSEDGTYWNWQDSPLLEEADMKELDVWQAVPSQLQFCLRNLSDTSSEETQERQDYEALLQAFIAAHAE